LGKDLGGDGEELGEWDGNGLEGITGEEGMRSLHRPHRGKVDGEIWKWMIGMNMKIYLWIEVKGPGDRDLVGKRIR
jgi:hypothetical protein